MEQALTCCLLLAISIEFGVSYDSTSSSFGRSSSTRPLPSSVESGHADYYWLQTILSSSLSIGNHSSAQTRSHSSLGDLARPGVLGCPSVFLLARSARSAPTDHLELPRAWYNSCDTPGRLFG